MTPAKIPWQGKVLSVQPRIRLTRSFDERSHSYLGYALRIEGRIGTEARVFLVGIGKAAQEKHAFRAWDTASGECLPLEDPETETVEFYKASKLKVSARGSEASQNPPPWAGVPLDLPTYRERGHRRLDPKTYEAKCISCIYGCKMAVEVIVDNWKPWKKRYRIETFCYGPKSCAFYRSGPKRKVPGRGGISYTEENSIDEDATSRRGPDD